MWAQSAPEHRTLFRLAWPILVAMMSYTMLSAVNAVFVGWLGTTHLAAIGISAPIVFGLQSFGIGLIAGVRILVANRTGAKQPASAVQATWNGLYVALILGVGVAAMTPLSTTLFRWIGASDAVAPLAGAYASWRIATTPVTFVFHALVASYQGRGDTRTAMVGNLIANGVNLVLDPILIFGLGPIPALGIEGAAIGLALGVFAGTVFLVLRAPTMGLAWPQWPHMPSLRTLWRLGAPTGVQYQLDVGSFVLLAGMLSWSGDVHLAAHVIVVRIVMMAFLPCQAIGEATGVLVGQRLGAGDRNGARSALATAVVQATVLLSALAVVVIAAPARLISVFGATGEVTALAVPIIVGYALIQVLDGVATVSLGALSGAGDTRFVMRASLFAAWLVKLPVAGVAILWLGLGAQGAWLGIGAEILTVLCLAVWRVAGVAWLERPITIEGDPSPMPVPAK